jgi:fibronectin-binding autotransporter adhesin
VTNNAAIFFNRSDNVTVANNIGGGGGVAINGTGTTTLTGTNTYTGTTLVSNGTLLVNGNQAAATGAITVANGATLGGTGTLGGATTVNSGGVIRGDSGTGTGTLNTRNVTVANGGNVDVNLGTMDLDTRIGTNNKLNVGTGTINLSSGAVVRLTGVSGFGRETHGTFILATLTNGSNILLDGGTVAEGQILGEYTAGAPTPNSGPIAINVNGLPPLLDDSKFTLRRSGNNLVLNFTPVPEPAFLLAVCGLAVGGVVGLRKVRRKAKPADVTPAA